MSPPAARRWNDQAIDGLDQQVRALGPAVGQVATIEAEVELLKERLDRFEDARRTIVVGLLSFAGAVSCALIAAAVTLVVHFTGAG